MGLTENCGWSPAFRSPCCVVDLTKSMSDDRGTEMPATPLQNSIDYRLAWETFQRLNRNGTVAAVTFVAIPLVTVLFFLASSGNHPSEPTETLVLTLAGAALFISFLALTYTRWQLFRWPCPRCGNRFHRYSYFNQWGVYFQTQCAHCKLRVWSDFSVPP
jgi:hypothetical protein